MLSQAHPYTDLFETIEKEPMNYIKAVTELMMNNPSVPPETVEIPYEEQKPAFGTKVMKLNLQKINEKSLARYKSAFYQLGKFSNQRNVEVSFPGLNMYKQIYNKDQCCSWFSQHKTDPSTNAKLEMIQLLAAIESQTKPSADKWVIEVTENL